MNDKTIIEFGFRIIWRNVEIEEGVHNPAAIDVEGSDPKVDFAVNCEDFRGISVTPVISQAFERTFNIFNKTGKDQG